jgi:farnesyl-diphosphate farnesyltransferase
LDATDRDLVLEVLEIITRGQERDLVRFGAACREEIVALETDDEMEEYTYSVAGCVGEFWTKMCLAHVLRREQVEELPLLADGIRFGKGLQLVNILRDLPGDLRLGRCYIPAGRLAEFGLVPKDLLDPGAIERFRPLYDLYLREAAEQLASGWDYTNALPPDEVRIRLACAWPILIGARTLSLLHTSNVLDDRHRLKVTRSDIRSIILRSILAYPFPSAWFRLFREPVSRQRKSG